MTEVLTSLRSQRLTIQFISATEVLTSLGDQVYVRSEIETPSGDGNTYTSHSCHQKVRPPKGYNHSTIQVKQDLNNLFISITK